jgi:hypothetical protein
MCMSSRVNVVIPMKNRDLELLEIVLCWIGIGFFFKALMSKRGNERM